MVEDDEGVRAAVVDMLTDLGYRGPARRQCRRGAGHCWKRRRRRSALHRCGDAGRHFHPRIRPPGAGDASRDQVLYTSGYTQNAIVHNGKLDDDAFLLSKPYRKDELARKLRSVFAGTARGPLQAEPPFRRGAGATAAARCWWWKTWC